MAIIKVSKINLLFILIYSLVFINRLKNVTSWILLNLVLIYLILSVLKILSLREFTLILIATVEIWKLRIWMNLILFLNIWPTLIRIIFLMLHLVTISIIDILVNHIWIIVSHIFLLTVIMIVLLWLDPILSLTLLLKLWTCMTHCIIIILVYILTKLVWIF